MATIGQSNQAGPWDDPALAKLREWDQAWAEQCRTMSTNPWTSGILPRKTVELIALAWCSACTNLNTEGLARQNATTAVERNTWTRSPRGLTMP